MDVASSSALERLVGFLQEKSHESSDEMGNKTTIFLTDNRDVGIFGLKQTIAYAAGKFHPLCLHFPHHSGLEDRYIKNSILGQIAAYNKEVGGNEKITARNWMGRLIDLETYDYGAVKGHGKIYLNTGSDDVRLALFDICRNTPKAAREH